MKEGGHFARDVGAISRYDLGQLLLIHAGQSGQDPGDFRHRHFLTPDYCRGLAGGRQVMTPSECGQIHTRQNSGSVVMPAVGKPPSHLVLTVCNNDQHCACSRPGGFAPGQLSAQFASGIGPAPAPSFQTGLFPRSSAIVPFSATAGFSIDFALRLGAALATSPLLLERTGAEREPSPARAASCFDSGFASGGPGGLS